MAINPSPAVLRACDLLAELASHPQDAFTVSELARRVGVPRATCDSLLLALAQRGLVRRDRTLRYELGPECIALGDAARDANLALRAAATHAAELARHQSACAAVTTREGVETRVADVFDHAPPFGVRARVGQTIPLVPPFGAVFVAWDGHAAERDWLDRADPPLAPVESARYRAALDAVRRRGYSVTVASNRQPELLAAIDRLVGEPTARDARLQRDELIRELTHSEYLPTDIDDGRALRVTQLSAPVFDREGHPAAAIMLLGPAHEISGNDISRLGDRLLRAAQAATQDTGGRAA